MEDIENDELNLDELDSIEENAERTLKVKNRIRTLSEKVKLTAQEKEELAKAKSELEQEKESISKERDFYKEFSTSANQYPQAAEYQDKIWEKVKGGYSTEDAIVAVLNKEGKLSASQEPEAPQEPEPQEQPIVEGGSAPTNIEGGDKGLSGMSAEEKRQALMDADKRGELESALRGGR